VLYDYRMICLGVQSGAAWREWRLVLVDLLALDSIAYGWLSPPTPDDEQNTLLVVRAELSRSTVCHLRVWY